jgi:fatty-acyl-CoA synthase
MRLTTHGNAAPINSLAVWLRYISRLRLSLFHFGTPALVKAAERGAMESASSSKTWLRALEMTSGIEAQPTRTLPVVIEELGRRFGEMPALHSEHATFSHAELAARANAYARWASSRDIAKGDVVCLMMRNGPEYLAIWLGITRIGGVVALINTNLSGQSLAHCVRVADAKHFILAPEFDSTISRAAIGSHIRRWIHDQSFLNEIGGYVRDPLAAPVRNASTLSDRALLIYTSGTTGLPKAAHVSHFRLMMWTHWFAGLMGARQSDRLYNCLPMYHSTGGVVASCAVLLAGGSVVIRKGFSANTFWTDVAESGSTIFQYIGELCRYLLKSTPPQRTHGLRLACGNGLAGDIWSSFQESFAIPKILEFYASSEGNFSLYNVEGLPGSIGRIPPFLRHRLAPAIVKFDHDAGGPLRNHDGRCIRVAPGEAGEAIGRISDGSFRFEGYTDLADTESKVLRDVFENGDAWMRTGDLMRQESRGFYYFIDRVGDTFRWKGENVATGEVAAALSDYPGVRTATVYGVTIPCADGRAGMAALEVGEEFNMGELHKHLCNRIPHYARPLFIRLADSLAVTETFKQKRQSLVLEGFDPTKIADPLYCNLGEGFTPLDALLYSDILSGRVRL